MTSGGGHYSNEDKIDTIATTKGGGGRERGKEVHKVKEAWRCARIETNEN